MCWTQTHSGLMSSQPEAPEGERRRGWGCVNGLRLFWPHEFSAHGFVPWRMFGSVWGESVSAWGQVRVGVGGCLWNLVGGGQRTASMADIVPTESVVLRLGWLSRLRETRVARRSAQLLHGSRCLALSFL